MSASGEPEPSGGMGGAGRARPGARNSRHPSGRGRKKQAAVQRSPTFTSNLPSLEEGWQNIPRFKNPFCTRSRTETRRPRVFSWLHQARGISAPGQGLNPRPGQWKLRSPNHWSLPLQTHPRGRSRERQLVRS